MDEIVTDSFEPYRELDVDETSTYDQDAMVRVKEPKSRLFNRLVTRINPHQIDVDESLNFFDARETCNRLVYGSSRLKNWELPYLGELKELRRMHFYMIGFFGEEDFTEMNFRGLVWSGIQTISLEQKATLFSMTQDGHSLSTPGAIFGDISLKGGEYFEIKEIQTTRLEKIYANVICVHKPLPTP